MECPESRALYLDPSAPVEDRVSDLLSRMSLEEKIRQMDVYSGEEFRRPEAAARNRGRPGSACLGDFDLEAFGDVAAKGGVGCIQLRYANAAMDNLVQRRAIERSRLRVPALFSEEALHGLIWPGFTVFPQQLGLAATFMPSLGREQGRAIAAEARSVGVCETWGPVLDLARDPRWGRVEEGYGEDTYLASEFAREMVRGLQGEGISAPDAIVAQVKHFSGYGSPTGGLNCAPATFGRHEHEAYCLPIFEAAIEAGAWNAMCSYNSIDNLPVAEDRSLLTDTLRGRLGLRGFLRADMTAVAMLHSRHFTAASPREAIRKGVEAGVDMQLYDFPHDFYQESLADLVRSGELAEAAIDLAAGRILRVKFELGLFERPYVDESLAGRMVHCPAHVKTALEVARKSLCLLKNEGGLLPLGSKAKRIAVIGPSADEPRLGGYSYRGNCEAAVSVLAGIRTLAPAGTQVSYARGCGILESDLSPVPRSWLRTAEGDEGLRGEYFASPDCSGTPLLSRVDSEIDFSWINMRPFEGGDAGAFSARWSGRIVPDRDFEGQVGMGGEDSFRLYLDGEIFLDAWGGKKGPRAKLVSLNAGEPRELAIELVTDQRAARVLLGRGGVDADIEAASIIAAESDVAIVCVGDSEDSCGENFDRSTLELPGRQGELVRRVQATGTPVVLVLQNGRPLSLAWEHDHVAAILEAWFPGEQGGIAIAEALFGRICPAGRLPMSFPKDVGQIPVHYNRKPFGATKYVEMDWAPLYPFGYGLSYASFEYSDLRIEPSVIRAGGLVRASFALRNAGAVAGEEVPQLYIHDCYSSVVKPYEELAGFARVELSPGESRTISFEIGERTMRTLRRDFGWAVEAGDFELMVGPDSADHRLVGRFTVE